MPTPRRLQEIIARDDFMELAAAELGVVPADDRQRGSGGLPSLGTQVDAEDARLRRSTGWKRATASRSTEPRHRPARAVAAGRSHPEPGRPRPRREGVI